MHNVWLTLICSDRSSLRKYAPLYGWHCHGRIFSQNIVIFFSTSMPVCGQYLNWINGFNELSWSIMSVAVGKTNFLDPLSPVRDIKIAVFSEMKLRQLSYEGSYPRPQASFFNHYLSSRNTCCACFPFSSLVVMFQSNFVAIRCRPNIPAILPTNINLLPLPSFPFQLHSSTSLTDFFGVFWFGIMERKF